MLLYFKDIFGEDFYIEIQDHGIDEERRILPLLIKLANEIGVELVATNDVHYLTKDDAEMQDVLMCIQMKKQLDDPKRMKFPRTSFTSRRETKWLNCLKISRKQFRTQG